MTDSAKRSSNTNKFDNDEVILLDLVSISNKKMDTNTIKPNQYISTENMKQNFLGITFLDELPKTDKITEFNEKDILISNIRPYLKKIWLSNFRGGCSSDIIVLHPHNKEDAEFIYYSLTTDKFINYYDENFKRN